MSNNREISTRIKQILKREFPNCKFSFRFSGSDAGHLRVLKAPKSWYTPDGLAHMDYLTGRTFNGYDGEEYGLTNKGFEAATKMETILHHELKSKSRSYYEEYSMEMVSYIPQYIYMFGDVEIFDDTMRGHRTRAPSKRSPAVKVNVRKMF